MCAFLHVCAIHPPHTTCCDPQPPMPDLHAELRNMPQLMPKFPSLARPSKTEDWHGGDGDAPTLSDGATVSSPGERRFDFDDTPPVGMREESLAPQTTEDFVGESLKRDLDFPSARHSEFPILQRPWQVADANRFKSSTAEQKSSDNEYAYVKLLLRSSVAQKLMTLCENNEQVASLLRPCHMVR
eukprot:Gregarina_sp_Poly_1__4028@NODE_221_length_11248_cov_177_758072_g195_i0_p7_GENE_NODE_221_length_11248_cov_177_758072_g195_i0NODE_221_length_11248_cov_177_758072_g195_i0_p7_ORF_typecomplete_len185_score31_49_NODE_221_length_11248_cov_177_758072_g195_i060926646